MLIAFQKRLGHEFDRVALLAEALTHPSWRNENRDAADNQRLEFLGDAVLDLVVSDLLLETLPEADEGELTRARAALVREEGLAAVARRLDLGAALLLGRGEENDHGREKDSVLADAYEAVMGAVYLDAGVDVVRGCVARHFGDKIDRPRTPLPLRDAKSRLQERQQARKEDLPVYEVAGESGPDHLRDFTVRVHLPAGESFEGRGRSKKEAQQAAAAAALEGLESGE